MVEFWIVVGFAIIGFVLIKFGKQVLQMVGAGFATIAAVLAIEFIWGFTRFITAVSDVLIYAGDKLGEAGTTLSQTLG